MAINVLDAMIINRISAGEVVESPFSIVKELIDNSLDAKATKITVEIKNGGIDQIIVKDNGQGIEKDDLVKAFLPHATSKIKTINDLDEIYTLGFRGEALASISNVSETLLISKTKQGECAYKIEVKGGKFYPVEPSSGDDGTTIEVNNLFFNTPARRKFLKKPKQEENQITNIIARYILAHPDINFKYIVDGETVYQSRGTNLLDAIYCVYGTEFIQNILEVKAGVGDISLSGYVSKIGFSKPNTTYQTLMINSRYVIDETVSKATYMAYEEYLMPRQFPVFILNLDMPATDVDANVHPNKMNVKFANKNSIYNIVYSTVRSAILNSIKPKENDTIKEKNIENNNIEENLIKVDLNSLKEIEINPTVNSFDPTKIVLRQENYSPITIFDLPKTEEKQDKQIESKPIKELPTQKTEETDYISVSNLSDYKVIGEIFNEFLILEKGENLIFMDFHAGHERLNYDKFTKMVETRSVTVQDLLVPYIQDLNVTETEFILNLKDDLFELGFDIEEFGDNKIKINSIPVQLKDINLKNFVDDLIHDMNNLKPSMNNEIKHYLMQKACKSSVRGGMTLSQMEINELLKNIDLNNPVLLCPHGRPVITVVKKNQIEKWFKRIV